MNQLEEFRRIYRESRVNYASIEDAVDELAYEFGRSTDPSNLGYGIARNASIQGEREVQRVKDKVAKVEKGIEQVADGIKQYDRTQRGQPARQPQPINKSSQLRPDANFGLRNSQPRYSSMVSGKW